MAWKEGETNSFPEFVWPHLTVGETEAQRGHGLPKVIRNTTDVACPVAGQREVLVGPTPSCLELMQK